MCGINEGINNPSTVTPLKRKEIRKRLMTAKELINKLSEVTPDTEIIGGMWNGRVDTYTVMDELHVISFDDIIPDLYGTPGAFDDKMLKIRSKDVVYVGSLFEGLDKRVIADRRVTWRMQHILRMHRSREWKKEQIYKLLQEFDNNTWSQELCK